MTAWERLFELAARLRAPMDDMSDLLRLQHDAAAEIRADERARIVAHLRRYRNSDMIIMAADEIEERRYV